MTPLANRTLAILGAPTAAGAHWPGQERAPAALREAGLIEQLDSDGVQFVDCGDLPLEPWQAARTPWGGGMVNNLDRVIAVAERVRDEVAAIESEGRFPVILGGDCTITVGAVAGLLTAGIDPGLIYVDGGWDLSSPDLYPAGIMDSMGLGHMLDLPGMTDLAAIAPRRPMLTPERFVQFGHGPGSTDGSEEQLAEQHRFFHVSGRDVRGNGAAAARHALELLPANIWHYHVHFDVDVIDFFDAPVADVPLHGNGLPYADAFAAVRVFVQDPRCVGLTVTEFNPDHASVDPALIPRFTADLAGLFAA
jgi:arginase